MSLFFQGNQDMVEGRIILFAKVEKSLVKMGGLRAEVDSGEYRFFFCEINHEWIGFAIKRFYGVDCTSGCLLE